MSWIRRILFEILASLLLLSLLSAVLATSLYAAVGHPQKVKTWVSHSGLYNQVVTNSINSAQNSVGTGTDTTAISLKDPAVQKVAHSVFTPEFVQQNVEIFIDSNYAWLQGKTATPTFSIDLGQTKQTFSQQVGKSVKAYLTGLPVCTPSQLAQLQANGVVNPLALACRPATLDPQAEANSVSQQLTTGPFIEHSVITADTISSSYGSPGSQPYYKEFSKAPTIYKLLNTLPYLLAVIVLLLIAGMLYLAPVRRAAVRRLAFVFLIAGIILMVVKVVADYIFTKLEHHVFTNQNASQLQQPLANIARQAEHALASVDLAAAIVFVIVSISLFIAYIRWPRPRPAVKQPTNFGPSTVAGQRSSVETGAKPSAPSRPPRNRLIQ